MSLLAQVMTMLGGSGLPDQLPDEPFHLLNAWFTDACNAKSILNPNAMVLATATKDGRPSARVVLCKDIRPAERAVVFYTNYESRKGREMAANPHVSVVFHFETAGQQARVEGVVSRLEGPECDTYFASRAPLSKIGAWASMQSQPIASRADFAQRIIDAMQRLGLSPLKVLAANLGATEVNIARPPHWGGFKLVATRVELWTNSQGRLHDRAEWVFQNDTNRWIATRLQP